MTFREMLIEAAKRGPLTNADARRICASKSAHSELHRLFQEGILLMTRKDGEIAYEWPDPKKIEAANAFLYGKRQSTSCLCS